MKNYYEELEVSKTASKEMIGKVYKILAKKYHPDTTNEVDKQAAEEKFKIISEAYEVLSDDEKRKKYDLELEKSNPTISYEDYINIVNQRDNLNNTLRGLQNEFNQLKNTYNTQKTTQAQYTQTQYRPNPNQFNQTRYGQPNQFNQARYGQPNQNFNNFQNTNYSNPNTNKKRKKYYYNVATGQPVSSFDYFKYRVKKFISNLGFYLILLIIFIILVKSMLSKGLSGFPI